MRSNVFRILCLIAFFVAMPAHALLPIQHWQTKSGARVYFVEARDLPMLDISVDFPAGSAFGTREKSGLPMLTQHLLRLGAGGLSDDEIAGRLADVGAQLGGRFDADRAGVSVRTLTSAAELEQALDLLARIVQRPEFPAAVLEREKARIIGSIREADTKPETLLARQFGQLAYGAHPYSLRRSGEADTVAALTRDDLVAFYRAHYGANRAVVALIGNLSRAEAGAIAERLTGELPQLAVRQALPEVPALTQPVIKTIEHPASQSHLMVGAPGIRRGDPDYFALFLGNHILGGGGFTSRITEQVREKRGLAYSAYSYFTPLLERGPFVIGLQTRRDQVGQALAVVRETLSDFVAKGPTADELKKAKQNLVGGFPLRIDSNRKILDYLATIGFYELPLTYLEDFVPNIEKVSIADVRAAFARRVNPDAMVTVAVGADEAALRAAR